ncbi:hypothetical protein ABEV00_05555 [Paenibacillus thiaminolyticus]
MTTKVTTSADDAAAGDIDNQGAGALAPVPPTENRIIHHPKE